MGNFLKKRTKKLKRRQDIFDLLSRKAANRVKGYKRPGSMNRRKQG